MLRKLVKHRPSPSLVISCLALFVALGSVGYAANGGNFILGQPNSATNQTGLTSSNAAAPSLNIANTGGRPAARFAVNGGIAPFTVSNATKIPNLNADRLDGFDSSGFVGVAASAGGDLSGPFSNLQINGSAVGSAEIADGSVTGDDVGKAPPFGSLGLNGDQHILDNTITTFDIAANAVDSDEVVDFGLSNQDVGVEFAQINANGTVANSSGGVSTIKLGVGVYEVDFGHNISSCAFVMTQGEAGIGGAGGAITGVTDRSGNAEAVFATTRTDANALADRAFQLVVVC